MKTGGSRPNAALAYKVLDHIDAHPEKWDQSTWWCDTGGCFAGWAVTLSGLKVDTGGAFIFVVMPVDGVEMQVAVDSAADMVLGIESEPMDAVYEIYAAENTREDLGRLVFEIFGLRPTVAA